MLALLKTCQDDLMAMQSILEMLPYLQKIPPHKVGHTQVSLLHHTIILTLVSVV
jgi:hypothetical protein